MTTTMSITTTTKSFTSHGLCFHGPETSARASKMAVSMGCWKEEAGEVKGLSVKCAGGGRNVRVDKVNGKKVNGALVSESDTMLNVDSDESLKNFKLGRFVEKRLVYRQTFVIRSYEIGPDKTATMETLMNLLQVRFSENFLLLFFLFCTF